MKRLRELSRTHLLKDNRSTFTTPQTKMDLFLKVIIFQLLHQFPKRSSKRCKRTLLMKLPESLMTEPTRELVLVVPVVLVDTVEPVVQEAMEVM